jgi:hypothetical protein
MHLRIAHPFRVVAGAGVLSALLGLGALAATATTPSPGSLLEQLQHPAMIPIATVGPGPVQTLMRIEADGTGLRITPNRATVRNRISVALTARGRPVDGAQVALTFSMRR